MVSRATAPHATQLECATRCRCQAVFWDLVAQFPLSKLRKYRKRHLGAYNSISVKAMTMFCQKQCQTIVQRRCRHEFVIAIAAAARERR